LSPQNLKPPGYGLDRQCTKGHPRLAYFEINKLQHVKQARSRILLSCRSHGRLPFIIISPFTSRCSAPRGFSQLNKFRHYGCSHRGLRGFELSGVTRGLSQEGQSLAEGGPLVTVEGPLAKTQKKVKK